MALIDIKHRKKGTLAELNAGDGFERERESEARSDIQRDILLDDTLQWLRFFHRDDTAVVSFLRVPPVARFDKHNRPKMIEEVASSTIANLHVRFPFIQPYLTKDAYFTINGFYKSRRAWQSPVGLNYVTKAKKNLRTLNAAYCDLDCGRPNSSKPEQQIPAEEALLQAQQMVTQGEIPPFSAYTFSGRGLYLFWRLHEDGKPLSAWTRNVLRYEAINNAIYERMRHLAADRMARDASRILRLPNSIHSKSGNRVAFIVAENQVYSLEELEIAFGIRAQSTPREAVLRKEKPPLEKMQGILALNRYRAEEILKIENHVGGWKEGTRRQRILVYAQCLRNANFRKPYTLHSCKQMAQRCLPPLDEDAVKKMVAAAYKGKWYRFRTETLCKRFGVSPELAEELQLTSFASSEVKASRQLLRQEGRRTKRAALHEIIREIIASSPTTTSGEISNYCKLKGIQISPRHINRIIKQLELGSRQIGRPKGS